jgi:prepilin-type N-terminal cleavage/methylation domain-containing protein
MNCFCKKESRPLHTTHYALRADSAFTLVEVLISVAIVAVIGIVAMISFFGAKNSADLKDTSQQIAAILHQAQSQAISGAQGVPWGVHFENSSTTRPFYALFSGAYSPSTTANRFTLPTDVAYATSSVPYGGSIDVIFAQMSGMPNAAISITLQLGSLTGGTSLIGAGVSRSASGEVFFDNFNRSNL